MSNKKKKKIKQLVKKKRENEKKNHFSTSESDTKENITNLTEEEIKRKRERYIEYGSEDDSEQDEAFKIPIKTQHKRQETNTTNGNEEISDDESIEKIMNTLGGIDGSSSDSNSKKTRNKNTKTGHIEPARFDDNGKRQLTTKELMAQYKKNKQKGGDSVDLSYKVGGKKKHKHKMEQKEGDYNNDSEGEY
eukprot:885372_1